MLAIQSTFKGDPLTFCASFKVPGNNAATVRAGLPLCLLTKLCPSLFHRLGYEKEMISPGGIWDVGRSPVCEVAIPILVLELKTPRQVNE